MKNGEAGRSLDHCSAITHTASYGSHLVCHVASFEMCHLFSLVGCSVLLWSVYVTQIMCQLSNRINSSYPTNGNCFCVVTDSVRVQRVKCAKWPGKRCMGWKWKSKKIIKRTQIPVERQFGTLWNLCRWRPRIPWPVAIVTDSRAGWRPTKTPERLAHYGICVGLQATDSGHIICTGTNR